MGACATAGNQLAQEEPILDAGAEQAQQMPGEYILAPQGKKLGQKAKKLVQTTTFKNCNPANTEASSNVKNLSLVL